jgi:hypothetical protein
VPVSAGNLFRFLVLLLMAVHGFYMYCMARSMAEVVGLQPLVVLGSTVFVALMMVPFAWAVVLTELPEIYRWLLGHRRWKAGNCTACRYPVRDIAGDACPECATPVGEPASYRLSLRTARRFAVVLVGAWILGSVAGEAWTTSDERSFAREVTRLVEAGQDGRYVRQRWWPAENGSLIYIPGEGIRAND